MGPKLLIFDADGVLIDIRGANAFTWEIILHMRGHADLLSDIMAVRDPMLCSVEDYAYSIANVVATKSCVKAVAEQMVNQWELIYPAVYARQPLIEGVEEALRELRQKAPPTLRIAVASNTSGKMVMPKLEPLRPFLDDIVVADQDLWGVKPDPGMFNYLLGKLGFARSQASAIGDGPVDVDAAKAADIKVAVVKGGWPGQATFYDRCIAEAVAVHRDVPDFVRNFLLTAQ